MMRAAAKSVLAVAVMVVTCAGAAADEPEMVFVGDLRNSGELSGYEAGGTGYNRVCGAVAYPYEIARFEVTLAEYVEFLNAVASGGNTFGLYNPGHFTCDVMIDSCSKIEVQGTPSDRVFSVAEEFADRPVNWVSWGDAARYCNWLHNGKPVGPQGPGTTEDGSYCVHGATTLDGLMSVTRSPDATYVIPSEDEWYKAAYYNPSDGTYYDFATSSDLPPDSQVIDPDPGNNATYGLVPTTDVGAHENSVSPYGTFDQTGNVYEWNEAVLPGDARGMRGGSAFGTGFVVELHAAGRFDALPIYEWGFIGFRVARVTPPDAFDLQHYAAFQRVYSAGTQPTACGHTLFDFDDDGTIGIEDHDAFITAFTGPQ